MVKFSSAETGTTDAWTQKFLQHLSTERGASAYTQRNYRQALTEFFRWHREERHEPPGWARSQRDDFRSYLRFLGRHNLSRAAIQLRFSALRSFYKFLIRGGVTVSSPIKNLALPKMGKRLPRFLTAQQMLDLLKAPLKDLELARTAKNKRIDHGASFRDVAILETIYSCGLRISELCGLLANDLDWGEQIVRVRGKGKKERLVPIGQPALAAIQAYWSKLRHHQAGAVPVFLANSLKRTPMYPRLVQLRLKRYLALAGLDPHLT